MTRDSLQNKDLMKMIPVSKVLTTLAVLVGAKKAVYAYVNKGRHAQYKPKMGNSTDKFNSCYN